MGLKFKDIDKWKPTSISIVDKPSHPLAVFEVYEDDEEFIKKYSPVEVDKLSNQEYKKNEFEDGKTETELKEILKIADCFMIWQKENIYEWTRIK